MGNLAQVVVSLEKETSQGLDAGNNFCMDANRRI
jgi:hypothetical protein